VCNVARAVLWCQVYGETSFELVSQMIEMVPIGKDDRFIDLGSGLLITCSLLPLTAV